MAGLLCGVGSQNHHRDLSAGYGHLLRDLRAAQVAITQIGVIFPICYGVQFANRNVDTNAFEHIFRRVCREHDIDHRLTKVKHPWTNGQVERMNRTIKEATVKRFHYEHHDQLRTHLTDFIAAYNFVRRLKTLNGLTPYEYICKVWTSERDRFTVNPIHQMLGLNTNVSLACYISPIAAPGQESRWGRIQR